MLFRFRINLTCIVDEDVQSRFRLQEVFSKAADRLQTPQIQRHEHHLVTATLLGDIAVKYKMKMHCESVEDAVLCVAWL